MRTTIAAVTAAAALAAIGVATVPAVDATATADATARADATAELIRKESPYSVTETLDRLESLLVKRDITVMARVDHAGNARKVGMELRPTQLLIFGKPEHGTALMLQSQTIGIDLPMKVLAWRDAAGQVWIGYEAPSDIAAEHGLTEPAEILRTMARGLGDLTDAAIAR